MPYVSDFSEVCPADSTTNSDSDITITFSDTDETESDNDLPRNPVNIFNCVPVPKNPVPLPADIDDYFSDSSDEWKGHSVDSMSSSDEEEAAFKVKVKKLKSKNKNADMHGKN